MPNESTKWLYEQLTKRGYNVGEDQSEFDSLMCNNPESRQWAYETARKSGLNVGKDIEEFTSLVTATAPVADAADAEAEAPAQGQKPVAAGGGTPPLPGAGMTDVGKTGGVGALVKGRKAAAREQAVADTADTGGGTPPLPGAGMTEQEKIQAAERMRTMLGEYGRRSKERVARMRRVTEAATAEGRQARKSAQTEARLAGTPTKVMGLTGPVPSAQGDTGGETSRLPGPAQGVDSPVPYGVKYVDGQAVTEWLLPNGELTTDLTEADRAEYMARRERLRRQYLERKAQEEADRLSGRAWERRMQGIDAEIEEARKEVARLKKVYDETEGPDLLQAVKDAFNSEYGREGSPGNAAARKAKNAAAEAWHTAEMTLERLERARERYLRGDAAEGSSILSDIGAGIAAGVRELAHDPMGVRSGVLSMKLNLIRRKVDAGEALTAEEKRLLDAYFLEGETQGRAKGEGATYRIAKFVPEMAAIAMEFAGAPGSGLTRKAMEGGIRKVLSDPKLFARAAGAAVAEGASIASTTQLGGNLAEAEGRMMSAPIYDDKGDVVAFEGDPVGVAMLKTGFRAVGGNAIFLPTTKLGAGIMRYLDKTAVGKGVADIFRNTAEVLPFGNPVDGLAKMKTSELLSVGLGDETFGQWADPENNAILIGSLLASEFAMGAPGKVRQGYRYYNLGRAKSDVKAAYKEAERVFSGRRGGKEMLMGLSEMIMSGNDETATNILSQLGRDLRESGEGRRLLPEESGQGDGRLTREEWVALTDMTRAVYRYRGEEWRYNAMYHPERLGGNADDEKGEGPEDVPAWEVGPRQLSASDRMENSYADGRDVYVRFEEGDATAREEADAVVARMQEAYGAVEDAFGAEAEYYMFHVNENPWALVDDPELTADQREAVLEFINARAALDGVLDASNEAAEGKRAEVEESVARRTHKDKGVIIPATMKVDDRPVYVVKGDVVMFGDGSAVDVRNSSESVIVMDAQTGEYRFTSPDQIQQVSEGVEAQQELDTALAEVERERGEIFSQSGVDAGGGTRALPGENGDGIAADGNNSVSLQYGNGSGQDNDWTDGDHGGNSVQPMASDPTGTASGVSDRSAIRMYEEGLGSERDVHTDDSERDRREAESERLVGIAEGGSTVAASAREENAGTALSRIPVDGAGKPRFTEATPELSWDAIVEKTGDEAIAQSFAERQVSIGEKKLREAEKAKTKDSEDLDEFMEAEKARLAAIVKVKSEIEFWKNVVRVKGRREEERRRQRDAIAHDEAVARFEEEQRVKAEKQAEQAERGPYTAAPAIRERWESSLRLYGKPTYIVLADGTVVRGRYVYHEAFAATPSHDPFNSFGVSEGTPLTPEGESVNPRHYDRDKDAQQYTISISKDYDARGIRDDKVVQHGNMLSGNGGVQARQMAARQGTDGKYVEALREKAAEEGIDMEAFGRLQHPDRSFEPDKDFPLTPETYDRFNEDEKKSQNRDEKSVRLGMIVSDRTFGAVVNEIAGYDNINDFYRDDKAANNVMRRLVADGIVKENELAQYFNGGELSDAGQALIEQMLIGKVFDKNADTVRKLSEYKSVRQAVVTAITEVLANRALVDRDYSLRDELSKGIDLVYRAKTAQPDVYVTGVPVSPFGRQKGLFDDEFGDSRVTDGIVLLLADILNSGKASDLRKVLASYNKEAGQAAVGQRDMFTGAVPSKEDILKTVIEYFRNATPKEQQALVDAAIAERKRRAEADAEQRERSEASEQTPHDAQRSAEPQQPTADGDTELEPLGKDRNDFYEDTPEEAALRARISVGDEWEEEGPAPDKPIYKRKLYVDGKHEVIQTDAPDKNGSYTGSQLTYDGRDFGDLKEVADYIDGVSQSEPTEAQKAAGNYKMEHRRVDGYDISIENAKGSVRRGTGADGKPWETVMQNDYGYIRGTEGVDGDHIDVFLSDTPEEGDVFVVDQVNEDGSFDEHKVMYGFPTMEVARDAYLSNYEPGWSGLGAITHVSKDEFKKWIASSRRKTKPFAEYKSVKPIRYDSQGNPIDENGNLIIEDVKSVADITDADFTEPTRTVGLPTLPEIVQRVLSTNGKKVIIKKNIFERNALRHDELPPEVSRAILNEALYNPTLYGKNKPLSRPNNWIVINVPDGKGNNKLVVLEVNENKDNVEIVHWHEVDNRGLEKIKRQAEREDGQLLILPSESSEEAGALSGPTFDVPSVGKDNTLSTDKQADGAESSEPYTITSTKYTNKKGKTSNVFLVRFNRELTAEEKAALNTFIREPLADGKKTQRGWLDHKQGGYMMRSEEAARQLAEMIGNEEAVADAQPMTAEELREAVGPDAEAEAPAQGQKAAAAGGGTPPLPGAREERVMRKAAVNRVSLEDLMTDLSEKGETKLSDHAEPVKAEPEQQHEISDDEMQSLAGELRDLLGIGDDEGDTDIKFRDPDELRPQERQRIQSAGIRLAMGLIERGTTAFPDYAAKMVGLLGDKIRPWLKSFYEGARWTPGYEKYSFTPSAEVATFDVQNLDKKHADPIAQAAMIVEERKAAEASAQAQRELTETRNKKRREHEQQTEADTAALAEKAEAVAGEAEVAAQSAGTGEAGRKRILRDLKRVDDTLEEVNDQLALLGYYEADLDAPEHEVYGLRRSAEKKAVKDAVKLAQRLVDDLGLGLDKITGSTTDKRGKKPTAVSANVAPDGGDIVINLPYTDGRNLYINIGLTPTHERGVEPNRGGGAWEGDNYEVERIMFRIGDGFNRFLPTDVTYGKMLAEIQKASRWDQPRMQETPGKDPHEEAAKAATDNAVSVLRGGNKPAKKRTEVKPDQPVSDLFGGLFDEPISDEKKTDVQSRPGTAERERGHEPQSHEPLGESQRHEVKGTDGRGMGGRSSVNPMSDGERGAGVPRKPKSQPVAEPLPESERKNVRNNHAERGVDYAPKGEDARIKANMEAIELAKRLLDAGEDATPEQMAVLRKFSGWGGLGKAFNEQGYTPNPIAKRLKELLGEDGYQDAVGSRRSAYYTPAEVIDTMWDVARAMGFMGGNVLEGSAGIGNIIGLMPTDMSERSSIHAVEIDRTTGGILSLLYPDAKVEIQGFEKTRVQNGTVDLAITNVPFITGAKVFDETGDKDLSKKFHDIHDFCIAKNIRKLREGGIGIFITSSGTMDNSKELRLWIIGEGNADVVGAFRMHNKTFGGTGATSDIIVVRKRVNGKPSAHAIDVTDAIGVRVADYDTGDTRKVKGQEIPVIKQYSMMYNKYFAEHPENMAGEMMFNFERGETRFPTSRALFPVVGKDQSAMLASWAGSFSAMAERHGDNGEMEEEATAAPKVEDEITRINEQLGDGVKEGSMVLNSQGELCMARMGEAVPLGLNKNKVKGHTKAECFKAYSAIKKALSDVLEYQSGHEGDEGLAPLLKELNRAFDTFTRTYGNLHKNTAISFLRNDVDFSSILALETYSEKGDKNGNKVVKVGKTDIFSRRVIDTEKEPRPTTVKDAILASLYKSGGVDVEYIGRALGKPTEEVKREIVSSGLGFEDPSTGMMEVSYKYLSGNVREKLHIAQENNADGRYDANIRALESVMPMTIPSHLIEFSLGSSWLEPKLYEDFVFEKTGLRVTLTNAGGTWFMKTPWSTFNEKNRSMAVVSKMCDKTIMGHELIEAAITNRQITVSKTEKHYDGSTETIIDKGATAECGTKVDEIRAEFKDWAREHMQADPAMSARIEQTYNERFNNYVPMSIPDEFVPRHFGGQVSELHGRPFALRPHQGRAVVRGTTEPILLAHEVGTGKTYTLITTAMEMRRLGTARKPMIVVQNATVGQFVESAKEIYPNAKVLTIEEADRTAEGRKNFYAKIKYNDWDMIVVPQSVFERIPDSEEREMAYVKDIIEEKMKVLEAMREADSDGRSMIVRQAERELAEQEARLAELTEAMEGRRKKRDEKREATTRQNAQVRALEMLDRETDDVENFDDMGIDAILVDEAHEYKHLGFATAMQRGVKGVDPSYSKKSQGVFLKAQAVMERNNGRNVVFATGTPISNTAAEIWTFMRYLMPVDTMKSYGIYYFDDFVRNFGNIAQMVEFSTNGKFKENNRFAGYVNLPELVRIWSGVADTVLTREAGGVSDKIPEMEGGKPLDIYLPQTRALRSVMKYVKAELDRYENMNGKEKKENSHIPLTMYGIAKAAAVDVRLVVPDAEDDPNSKTNTTVRETLRSLRDSEKYRGTVAIFSDNYQNKRSGFNLYEDIRKKLIAEGVPAEQIVVIKPGMTVKKKLDIFERVNAGEIRVIMGSTFTLGTGVNIQERLHTLIHVDAPNRPMDYTQRNGRALRQGNLHKDMGIPVRIIRFGVEDSLDVTAYQRLKTKGAIADSIMNGSKMMQNSMENRVLEEEEDTFGDMTAQLSGSEYAILKNQAEREVRNLTAKQKGHDLDQIYVHNQLPKVEGFIRGAESRIEREERNLAIIGSHFPDGTIKKITIGKLTFESVAAMEDFFKEQNAKMNAAAENVREGADTYTSKLVVDVDGLKFEVTTTVSRTVDSKGQGTLTFEPERSVTYSCEELGIKDQAIKGNRLKNIMQKIAEDIVTGRESRELLSRGQRQLAHYTEERTQLEQRNGREFPYKKELAEAKERLAKYEEAMKKELAEKEAKYAEMDKSVETARDITLSDEDSTDTETTGEGNKYREGVEMSEGERLRAIRALEPIEVERNEMSRDELREVYYNLPSVEKDGREIEFYRSAFKKIYKEGGLFGQVVPVLDEVLEKSVLAYSESDNLGGTVRPDGTIHKAHPDIISFDNYVGKVHIDGKEYYVRTTVQRGFDGRTGTHSFFVTGVDLYEKTAEYDSSPGYPRATEISGENSTEGRTIPITSRGTTDVDGIVDAKLQQFFERASSEANILDMRERVEELSERLHAPVRIISDASELAGMSDDGKPRYSRRERRAKGWWSAKADEVVIVLPNNVNVADVANTFVHEVVGHKGLRALFNTPEKLNNFLDESYRCAFPRMREEIDKAAQRMIDEEADRLRVRKAQAHERAGEDVNANYYTDMAEARVEAEKKREEFRREATEEWYAEEAGRMEEEGAFEKMEEAELSFWGKILSELERMMNRLLQGLGLPPKYRLTLRKARYILYRSYKYVKDMRGKGGVFAEAEDAVMRRRTGWDADMQVSEKRARIEKLRRSEPVTVREEMLPADLDLADRKAVKTALKERIRGTVVNEDTGEPISIYKDGINEVTSHGMTDPAHVKSLFAIPEMLKKSIFIDEMPNSKDHTDYDKYLYYVCGLKIGGEDYTAKIVVGVKGADRYYDHRLSRIEKGKLIDSLNGLSNSETENEPPSSGYKGMTLETLLQINDEEDGVVRRFRDGDPGLEEYITRMKTEAMAANAGNLQAKREAMRAIGGNLNHLRQAMARQREYDVTTVKSVTDLARILLEGGLLDDLSKAEVKRILSAVNNVVGRQDVSLYVGRVMDIMVDNQLRMGANALGRLLSIRGSRVDARGIEVQGELDAEGQRIAQVVRKSAPLPKEEIESHMAAAMDRMGSADGAIADEAAIEYAGLQISRQYAEDITESKAEEKALRDSIKEMEAEMKAGHVERAVYVQYKAATEDAIRQNKIERAEAYGALAEQIGGVLGESVGRAKAWREAEKERVAEIHHNANSDMEGRPADEHHKDSRVQKLMNNSLVRFVLAPLGTFDQMLRMFGGKSVRGEGYLWNRYMRGWVRATEKEYTGYRDALKALDAKVSEVYGKKMRWGDLFGIDRRLPKGTVRFYDGGEMKDHVLTQGNLLYIYMADKMSDGRMKLRAMGIKEEDVEAIRDFLDPKFIELADWMQEEFLVDKRTEYNEVHKRMFGASMAAIENYFPLKILANARLEDVDVADDTADTALPATSTGSIIKRRRNNLALDVTGANAFSAILDHLKQMERWAAFAEFNRDLNTLLSYKRFRNQVMNMSSVYGAGKTLWNNFRNVCSMAAGAYRPPVAELDKVALNIAKGVTAAKVSFRMFTALKQFASMPAYLSDSNPMYLAADILNPFKAWCWSMENLPLFEKRWRSRMAGDPRLLKSEMDWKLWRSRVVEIASRVGMSPNAFVDALTVSIGAHAMYKTKLDKYKRQGYEPDVAEERAKQDTTILFNQTQQSSEGAFLSTMQVDRSWLSVLFTIFRNASMAYTRQLYDALRNLGRRLKRGYKAMSEEFMAKQMMRDGIDPYKADRNAKQEYRRGIIRDLVRVGIFCYGLQFAWNLCAYLPYLIFGDDDDEKDIMWTDIFTHTIFGSIEGLTGGDVISNILNAFAKGEKITPWVASKDMPLASDLENIWNMLDKDEAAAMNDVINIVVQSGVGVNPQSLTDAVVAVMDACGEDAQTSRECALLMGRIINCPQSQLDKIYFDELDATAEEASRMTPAQIAERYAEYKMLREAPLTGWMRGTAAADSVKAAKEKRVLKEAKARLEKRTETEQTRALLAESERITEELGRIDKLWETDRAAARAARKRLRDSTDMRRYRRVKRYKHDMKELTEKYLKAAGTAERDSVVNLMFGARERMLEDVGQAEQ